MKNLWLGIVLIAAASSVLLLSDLNQRKGASSGGVKRIALVQHASQMVLEQSAQGVLDGLAAHGFADGKNLAIQRFNAENEIGTANAIARQVVSGGFDLVITISTISTQTVANANQAGKTKQVFGAVSDPFSAGLGVSRENPANHPKNLTGIGSMVPVDRALALAKQMYPGLKRVGLVWNSSEANSLAYTKATRAACEPLGLQLLEANAENSSAVLEAASSLVSRGAEALFITGDVTVLIAADSVMTAAKRGHIPAFTIMPGNVDKGALFDVGANFVQIGREVGDLAAKVLNGADPGTIPVTNLVPEKLMLNQAALAGLREAWKIPEDVAKRAAAGGGEKAASN